MQTNFLIDLFYIAIIFSLILVVYRSIKVKNLDNKVMVLLSILVSIFPFSPLALIGGMMGIFSLFDERLWYRNGFLQIIISLWLLGGIVGLTGLIKSLLGHHTKYEFWLLVYGFISYLGLFILLLVGIVEEGTIIEFYREYKSDKITISMISIFTLYLFMSIYILFWHMNKLYSQIYKK